MRALALVLVVAPAALATLVAPPPAAWAEDGCTPCECGVAMCMSDSMYFYEVEITGAPTFAFVGDVFHVDVRLGFGTTDGSDVPENLTVEHAQLFLSYAYVDPTRPNRTPTMTGSAQIMHNATYPGTYDLPLALAVPGTVDLTAWTTGAQSEPRRMEMLAEDAAKVELTPDDGVRDVGTPRYETALPITPAILAIAGAAIVVRRRR